MGKPRVGSPEYFQKLDRDRIERKALQESFVAFCAEKNLPESAHSAYAFAEKAAGGAGIEKVRQIARLVFPDIPDNFD